MKKDQTLKLAMNSKQVSKSFYENKHRMPNIDVLLDKIEHLPKKVETNQIQHTFSTVDVCYEHRQPTIDNDSRLPSDKKTHTHCNFSFISGRATKNSQFQTGPCGLTDMCA